jgi:hypothetical protein
MMIDSQHDAQARHIAAFVERNLDTGSFQAAATETARALGIEITDEKALAFYGSAILTGVRSATYVLAPTINNSTHQLREFRAAVRNMRNLYANTPTVLDDMRTILQLVQSRAKAEVEAALEELVVRAGAAGIRREVITGDEDVSVLTDVEYELIGKYAAKASSVFAAKVAEYGTHEILGRNLVKQSIAAYNRAFALSASYIDGDSDEFFDFMRELRV